MFEFLKPKCLKNKVKEDIIFFYNFLLSSYNSTFLQQQNFLGPP